MWGALRRYCVVIVLGGAAVVFALVGGVSWHKAAPAVAAALAGAALARFVDVIRESAADAERQRAEELVGIDETRRLMRAIRAQGFRAEPTMCASVVNALFHHPPDVLTDDQRADVAQWEQHHFSLNHVRTLDATFSAVIDQLTARERELKGVPAGAQ
jgi:hypothetical protein